MKHPAGRLAVWALGLVVASGCTASRPMIYPSEQVEQAGAEKVQADVDECLARAEAFDAGQPAGEQQAANTAKKAAVGAGVGAAAGAAGGAFWGGAGRGAAAGAAGGAAAGIMSGLLDGVFGKREPDPVYKTFVARCLQEKGYEVIGWK